MKALLLCTLLAMPAATTAADEPGAVAASAAAPDTAPQVTFRHARMWTGPLVFAPPTQSGEEMRAVIDSKTGELRAATPGELRAAQLLSPSRATSGFQRAAAPAEIHHADGSVSLQVPEELMNYSVVRIDAGGQVAFSCVDGHAVDHDHAHAAAAPEVE